MAAAATQSEVTQPLLPEAEPAASNRAHAQPVVPQATQRPHGEQAAQPPVQTGTLRLLGLVLVVVILLVAGAALLSRSGVIYSDGPPPQCRKSAALALLRQAGFSTNRLQEADSGNLQLLIWGGRGRKSDNALDDLHVMNLQDRKWHAIKQKAGHVSADNPNDILGLRNIAKSASSQHAVETIASSQHAVEATESQLPEARWKQLSATDPGANTMVMFGGDGLDDPDNDDDGDDPDDDDDDQDDADNGQNSLVANDSTAGNGHNYFNDAWTVGLYNGKARWQGLWNTDAKGLAPVPRRAAAGALYSAPNSTIDRLYIHGGRHQAGHLLDDFWEASLGVSNITYQELQQGKQLDRRRKDRPRARKGHCAVIVHDTSDPTLVIFGGRNNFGYFNDVWAWKINTGTWEQWSAENEVAPIGRDHFGAVYDAGHVYIFGGRGGSSYGDSKPLDDLWRFSVDSKTWTQLNATGSAPLPRFLFSYDIFYPVLHQSQVAAPLSVGSDSNSNSNSLAPSQSTAAADEAGLNFSVDASVVSGAENKGPAGAMVVFGGESVKGCYLNDVWVLHLNSLLWQQLSKPVACQKRCRELLEGH